jgi:DNA ligase D-like protein (predicted polymerase)
MDFEGLTFTHLDEALFDGAGATKRDLVDYLDGVSSRLVEELRDRPLSVIRVRPGSPPFMQKNLPSSAPEWVSSITLWAESSRRDVTYALCNDRRTLLWFANQRAVEYHPTLARLHGPDLGARLVLDLDPPDPDSFAAVVATAHLVHHVLDAAGLVGALKTSGAKGLHVFVPVDGAASPEDVAAATRALAARVERLDPALATTAFMKDDRHGKVFVDATRAGGATVVAAYSPRARPGLPVSFPVPWDELDVVSPADFTVHTALARLGERDPWAEQLVAEQPLPDDLVAEGHTIPLARVQAMHEGKRRARARRSQ